MTIEIHSHFETPTLSIESFSEKGTEALPLCLQARGEAVPALLDSEIEEIEVSLISDDAIARVHGEFMDDPTPTDVITFHHGEILISAETAARCAIEQGHPTERETLLYLIHGLLHLNGHDDLSELPRALMHSEQERILETLWPFPSPENRG